MRRAALLIALIAILALAALAGGSPQPRPICGFCGDSFEDVADEHGVNATVSESTATVQVHENGSATWTVRNRLTNGSERFREDTSGLPDVGRALADSYRGVAEEPRFVSAEMDGDTAVLVYRDANAVERHAGLLVVDYLHDRGYDRWFIVNADEFAIRGPAGTVVSNDPESGTVDGRSVTWRGSVGGGLYEAPNLDGSPYVVFGPDRSTGTDLRTRAALALSTLPIVVASVERFLVPQVPLFALSLALVGIAVRRRGPTVGVEPLAAVLAGVGGLGGVALAVVDSVGSIPGPAVFAVIVGGLAAHPKTRRILRTPRRQALVAAGALAVTWMALLVVFAGTQAYAEPAAVAFSLTALALPFAALLPLGGALDAGGRATYQWGGIAVLAFAVVPLAIVNFADPPSGMGSGLAAMAFLLAALLFPVVGAVVLVLGRQLSGVQREDVTGTRRMDDV